MIHNTPAVNIDATEVQAANWYKKYCGATDFTLFDASTSRVKRYIKHRPESVHNPLYLGWRQPSGYFRDEAHMTVQPQGHYSMIYGPTWCGGSLTAEDRWDNGYGWDLVISDVPAIPSWMVDVAAQKAYAKMKDSSVNLSTNFYERKQAADLVSGVCRGIAKGVRLFRSSNPAKAWREVKREGTRDQKGHLAKVPQKWLELQYGWKPGMSDCREALKKLQHRDGSDRAYRIRVHTNVKDAYSKLWKKGSHISDMVWQDVTDVVERNVKIMLCYEVSNPLQSSLADLGLTNPATLVWEELPFSFVVDWFLPIGSWLGSWDADFGLSFKGGSQTEFTKVKSTSVLREAQLLSSSDITVENRSVPYRYEGFVFRRGALIEPPGVGYPHFKNPFSALHVSEALSLLATAFR